MRSFHGIQSLTLLLITLALSLLDPSLSRSFQALFQAPSPLPLQDNPPFILVYFPSLDFYRLRFELPYLFLSSVQVAFSSRLFHSKLEDDL